MSKIISLDAARKERSPYWEGQAQCLACRYEWHQVAPIGTIWLDCPKCGLPQGHPKYPFGAEVGEMVFTCTPCGGQAFTSYKRDGYTWVRCMACGNDVTEGFFA